MKSKNRIDMLSIMIMRTPKITASQLSAQLNISSQEVREIINAARSSGIPILTDGIGYFIDYDVEKIDKQIDRLKGRISKMVSAIEGLERLKHKLQTKTKEELNETLFD